MDRDTHIIRRCSDCAALLGGGRIEPHEYLVIIQHTPEEEIYRCLLCYTCLTYAHAGEQAWALVEMSGTSSQPRHAARTLRLFR